VEGSEEGKTEKTKSEEKVSEIAESAGISRHFNKKIWVIGVVAAIFLIIFLFLDWRVKDVCKWSRFEEMPNFSKRVDLISSIFKKNTYHIYFVLDYKDYRNKEKLLDDSSKNQKEIRRQLKKAGLRDDEITISFSREIYTYEDSTSNHKKTILFGMNGVAIDIKTKNKRLYDLLSSPHLSISRKSKTDVRVFWPLTNLAGHNIGRSSRSIFSFSITAGFFKILDCTRVNLQHCTLVEEKTEDQDTD